MLKKPEEIKAIKDRFSGLYDSRNMNVFDPDDALGYKTYYIHILQELAIRAFLKSRDISFGVDFSCGDGRITNILADYCENVIGMDIDHCLIEKAKEASERKNISYVSFVPGDYPRLDKKADVVLCCAALHMKAIGKEIPQVLRYFREIISDNGRVIVVDNCVSKTNRIYFSPEDLIEMFKKAGFLVKSFHPIRKGHTIKTYIIRYGLIRNVQKIRQMAEKEIETRSLQKKLKDDYYNFIFEFTA